MTSLRAFRPQDLFRFNLTNLDPLTENYGVDYYFQYLFKWPSLFTCTEDQHNNITGYVMGKVEEDPNYLQFLSNYLPWHGHVTALTVAPQHRRLGLAKMLTGALERGSEAQNAWFVDLFVRAGNATAIGLYTGMGYSVYRRVLDYYSDDPTGKKSGEDAFDMRKPLARDKRKQYIRENGEDHHVNPEDIYHG